MANPGLGWIEIRHVAPLVFIMGSVESNLNLYMVGPS